MRERKKHFYLPVLSLISLIVLVYLILNFPPTYQLSFFNLQSSIINLFFILIFLTLFPLIWFILASKAQGFVLTVFPMLYFILKLANLTQAFFLILLFILFGTVEIFLLRKK